MNYKETYKKLIEKRKNNPLSKEENEYIEYHHIKPKSLYPDLVKDPENLVALTPKEHYVAHLLLVKIALKEYGPHSQQYFKLLSAFWLMSHKNRTIFISSSFYEKMRKELNSIWKDEEASKEIRLKMRNAKLGKTSPRKGQKLKPETLEKMRKANLGKKQSEETKRKRIETRIRNGNNKLSPEHKEKLRQSRLGAKHTEETKERIRKKKLGQKHTEEAKKKISQNNARIYLGKHLPESVKKKLSESMTGEKNPGFNKIWMYNKETNKRIRIYKNEEEEYIKLGYLRGKEGRGGIKHVPKSKQ